MKIQGVNITGGIRLIAPTPTPSGPSKFVVGAHGDDSQKGAAYVYNTDGTGEVKITASDAGSNELFGYGVGMSSTKVVVGAPFNDASGDQKGAVYVYNTDGTGEQMIVASDGGAGDVFGISVAATDTHIVVGASRADSFTGCAYIYNTDGTGEVKIQASDGAASDYFGESVAVTDTKVIVGAWADDDAGGSSGSVYVYNTDGTGEVKITASDAAGGDRFGYSVAATDTKIIVGAIYDAGAGSRSGSVYVYNLDGTGELKITASDGAVNDYFGKSVAASDTKIVVVSEGVNGYAGAVYVYNTDGTGEVKITASDGAASDYFGRSVAINGDKIIVGAYADDDSGIDSGSVYVYNLDGTGEVKITASDGADNDYFGQSVASVA